MPTIISSTRLRNEYNTVAEECRATGRPVFVTHNGNGDLAIMIMEAYERLVSDGLLDLRALLEEGHADAEAGRTRSAASVVADLRARIGV